MWWKPTLRACPLISFHPQIRRMDPPRRSPGVHRCSLLSYAGVGQPPPHSTPLTQQLWLFKGQAALNAHREMCQQRCTISTFVKLLWRML